MKPQEQEDSRWGWIWFAALGMVWYLFLCLE